MTTAPIIAASTQVQATGNASNPTPNADAYAAFSAGAFSGQSSFLALLLGQNTAADGFKPIDLSNFVVPTNTGNTASTTKGFNLDNFSFDRTTTQPIAFNTEGQIAGLSSQQGAIQENNQKIREFLTSLIETLQGVSNTNNVAAAPSSTHNVPTHAASKEGNPVEQLIASLINGGNNNTEQTPVTVTTNAQGQLSIDLSTLSQADQNMLLQQASILSSGISIPELTTLKTALAENIATTKPEAKTGVGLGGGTDNSDNPLALQGIGTATNTGNNANTNAVSRNNHQNGHAAATNADGTPANANSNANNAQTFIPPVASQSNASSNAAIASLTSSFADQEAIISTGQPTDPSLAKGLEVPADTRSLQNITNPAMAVRQAGMPHPASESLAVQIQRQAKANGKSELLIQLDPPELGKVKVQMNIDAHKAVNAKITVERPETLAMLQRDEGVLQKALQDMGLDVTGENVSFDLAYQGSDSQNGQMDFGKPDAYAGIDNGLPNDVIETKMNTIYIDPNTGHVRVNILA